MNHDAVDYFRVDFTPEDSIVDGKHYPLGTFAAEMLDRGWEAAADIRWPLKRFQEEFQVFLASRNPSSSGMALQAMRELWRVLGKLPLYNKLLPGDHQMEALLPYLREHPDLTDDMLTLGTPRNEAYTRWMEKLEGLEDELRAFIRNTEWMLEEFFQELPSRRRQDYLQAYANYRWTMEEAAAEGHGGRRGSVGRRHSGPGYGLLRLPREHLPGSHHGDKNPPPGAGGADDL